MILRPENCLTKMIPILQAGTGQRGEIAAFKPKLGGQKTILFS